MYAPCKILYNLCFSFFLGIVDVPREIENSARLCTILGGKQSALWEMCKKRIYKKRLTRKDNRAQLVTRNRVKLSMHAVFVLVLASLLHEGLMQSLNL